VRTTGHRLPIIAAHAGAKSQFRRAARAAGAVVDWAEVGEAARAHLAEWLAGRAPTTVVLYLALDDEPPVEGLAVLPELGRHHWAVTRTGSLGVELSVHPFDCEREWHRFGYQQPVAGSPLVAEADIGVVLVPGVAFDRWGGRLGRGRGYYDRLLARLAPDVDRVGVSADALVWSQPLPLDAHDLRMDWLATASGVRRADGPPPPAAATAR
jgi:5-formyltetrahydrofolate cyclo-ligase